MNPRVFIVHGWGAYPQDDWIPWLKGQLEDKGCEVYNPSMPDTEHPQIETWLSFLANLVGDVDENTYFVGHSIGCQTILRYALLALVFVIACDQFSSGMFALNYLESIDTQLAELYRD